MPSSILSVYTTFMGNACENKTNSTFPPSLSSCNVCVCECVEVKLFLRLSATCLLILAGLLCYSAFESGGWRKRESTNLFASIQIVLFQDQPPLLIIGQERGAMLLGPLLRVQLRVCFPFMNNHMKHFADNVHFIIKTKYFPHHQWNNYPSQGLCTLCSTQQARPFQTLSWLMSTI